MSLGENVDHLFELRANLVFSAYGVEVEEAYGRTLALPGGLQLRAGQFLTRMGRLNAPTPIVGRLWTNPSSTGPCSALKVAEDLALSCRG